MSTQVQPGADTKMKLETHVQGRGLLFEVGGENYILRPPTPAERDEASRIEQTEKRWLRMTDEKVKALADMDPPQEEYEFFKLLAKFEERIMREAEKSDDDDVEELERRINGMYSGVETRTAADKLVQAHGKQVRNRYLAKTLLCDNDWNPLSFDMAEIALQEEATRKAEELWDSVEELPFLSKQGQS